MKVPLFKPEITQHEISRVTDVLKSGYIDMGPVTREFEAKFAEYIGTKQAVSFNSWTSGMHVLIQALGLKGEIVVPGLTLASTVNVVETGGCTPVFAEVEARTCNLDPGVVKEKISDRTVAVSPVHYGGQSCEMDKLQKICKDNGLILLEDAAQAIGSTYNGQKLGTFGLGVFSLSPPKNVTAGSGGMVALNDDELADKLRTIRVYGGSAKLSKRMKQDTPWFRASVLPGYNMRMCDILGALGLAQLERVEDINSRRRANAAYYTELLRDVNGIAPIPEHEKCKHVYQKFICLLDSKVDRKKLVLGLREKGIGADVHFDPPVHLHPYYVEKYGYKKGDLPVTEECAERIISLPMFPHLEREEIEYVVENVKTLLAQQ